MKWIKTVIGALIVILSVGIIATSVYNMTQETVREEVVTFEVLTYDSGNNPKIFENDDVLPATTQLRIIAEIPGIGWHSVGGAYTTNEYLRVYAYDDDDGADYDFRVKVNGLYLNLSNYNLSKLVNNEWVICEYVEYSTMSVIIDTSTWTETQRTIVNDFHPIYWEDLNSSRGSGTVISGTYNKLEMYSIIGGEFENRVINVTSVLINDVETLSETFYIKYDDGTGYFLLYDTNEGDYDSILSDDTLNISLEAIILNDVVSITFEVTQPPQLTGINATLIFLIPIVFVGGVLLYFYKLFKKD